MGGDCCDPDFENRSNSGAFDVVSYDFAYEGEAFVPYKPDGKDTPWPTARMGHALVAPSADRLWVIGGWRPNGGSCPRLTTPIRLAATSVGPA